jgi:hypothetical protein
VGAERWREESSTGAVEAGAACGDSCGGGQAGRRDGLGQRRGASAWRGQGRGDTLARTGQRRHVGGG